MCSNVLCLLFGLGAAQTAPAATTLGFSTEPVGSVTGLPLAAQPHVVARTDGGAVDTTYTGTVTLSIAPNTGAEGAALSGTVAVAMQNGEAAFSGVGVSRAGLAYRLRATSGTLTVDSQPFDVLDAPLTIPLDTEPYAVAAIPDPHKVFITNQLSPYVTVLNADTNTLEAPINIGDGSNALDIAPGYEDQYRYLLITDAWQDRTLQYFPAYGTLAPATVLEAGTFPAASLPWGPTGMLVAEWGKNRVRYYSLGGSLRVEGAVGTNPISMAPAGTYLFVANYSDSALSVLDAGTLQPAGPPIPVPMAPTQVAASDTLGRVYVASSDGNAVTVFDSTTRNLLATIPVAFSPYGLAVDEGTHRVYVADLDSADVAVIDGVANRVVARIPVGARPHRLAVDAATHRVYVACTGGKSVSVIAGTPGNVRVYVSPYGDDASDGFSWAAAKKTVQAGASQAARYGGGEVWVARGSYAENIHFAGNVALYGGFTGSEDSRNQRDWRMNPCTLDGGRNGPVVSVLAGNGAAVIDGFTIQNGSGMSDGAGAWHGGGVLSDGATLTVENRLIAGNAVHPEGFRTGGGVEVLGGAVTLRHNRITGNNADDGAGIHADRSTLVLIGNEISNDTAEKYTGGGASLNACTSTLVNNTIAGNTAQTMGGGLYVGGGGATFVNNLIAGNTVAPSGSGGGLLKTSDAVVTEHHNLFGVNSPADVFGLTPAATDILADPAFVPGGYHLSYTSPAIDAGDDSAVADATDLSGVPRIEGAHVDLGAYEYWLRYSVIPPIPNSGVPGGHWSTPLEIDLLGGDPGDQANVSGTVTLTISDGPPGGLVQDPTTGAWVTAFSEPFTNGKWQYFGPANLAGKYRFSLTITTRGGVYTAESGIDIPYPYQMVIRRQPVQMTAGVPSATPVEVLVLVNTGVIGFAGFNVQLTVSSGDLSAVLSNNTARAEPFFGDPSPYQYVTASAVFNNLVIDRPGTYVLKATALTDFGTPNDSVQTALSQAISVSAAPYTMDDARTALAIAAGLQMGSAGSVSDAVRIARKVAGLDPNP